MLNIGLLIDAEVLGKIKVFLCLGLAAILCFNVTIAKVPAPSFELDVDLKKDEILRANISASKDQKSDTSSIKQFSMRWTLYRNEGLVMIVHYDSYPYQFMLYKQYVTNVWNLNLLDTQGVYRNVFQPHLRIQFISIDDPFNDEKTIVHLRITGYGYVSFVRE